MVEDSSSTLSFEKILSANDVGDTNSHQAGMHISKTDRDFLDFLPPLEKNKKNPDAWLYARDETGATWKFRYIYYNNKFFGGTRNEYRITHTTRYLNSMAARPGDRLRISKNKDDWEYQVFIVKTEADDQNGDDAGTVRIKLTGWNRSY